MEIFKRSTYFLMLFFFGGALLADCEFQPYNDFRNFKQPTPQNSWECPEEEVCDSACDFTPTRWLANQIEVGAEALYWKPSYGGVQYGVEVSNTPINTPLFADSEWNWGYRIDARWKSCSEQLYLSGDYVNFCQSNSDNTVGAIIPVFSGIGATGTSAQATTKSKYEAADISAGYRWFNCPCITSSIFAGARYFNINEAENYQYGGLPSGGVVVVQKYRIRGWGPRIGFDFAYHPFACGWLGGLGFRGMVAQMAGIGSQKQRLDNTLTQLTPVTEGFQTFPTTQELLLNTDMRIETFYRLACSCVKLQVSGGYEFNYYSNARFRVDSAGSLIGSESRQRESLGYGGPFVGFNLFW